MNDLDLDLDLDLDPDPDPASAGFDAVISGHSHQPHVDYLDGVLYLNPGSAGRRRYS